MVILQPSTIVFVRFYGSSKKWVMLVILLRLLPTYSFPFKMMTYSRRISSSICQLLPTILVHSEFSVQQMMEMRTKKPFCQ